MNAPTVHQGLPAAASVRNASRPAAGAGFDQQLREESAREVAEQLVSEVFIEPILASMREHSTAAGPFAPGDAERRFGPMLDQHIADRVTHSARLPLVDEITRRLAARTAHESVPVPNEETPRVALEA